MLIANRRKRATWRRLTPAVSHAYTSTSAAADSAPIAVGTPNPAPRAPDYARTRTALEWGVSDSVGWPPTRGWAGALDASATQGSSGSLLWEINSRQDENDYAAADGRNVRVSGMMCKTKNNRSLTTRDNSYVIIKLGILIEIQPKVWTGKANELHGCSYLADFKHQATAEYQGKVLRTVKLAWRK